MTKESFLELASKHYDSICALNEKDNFYDYEKEFVEIIRAMGQEILTANLGELPTDKRKKKTLLTTLGKISISNSHSFAENVNGFQSSPLMQDLTTYAGQLNVYEKGNDILKRFLGVEISTMQVNNITDFYGEQCGDDVLLKPSLPELKYNGYYYCAVDGSMLFTRDEEWKEVKVMRLFRSSDCIDPNGKESWIRHSQYYGYLGDSKSFTDKVDILLDNYNIFPHRLIFLSDGAIWIRNWIEDAYPGSIAILDFFHALEHLHDYRKKIFGEKEEGKKWAEDQVELFLESKIDAVISNIKIVAGEKNMDDAEKLTSYYESNKTRMDYKYYKTIGTGIIGSGAIESAHRTLIQDRMKKAGQRWSKKGAQNMINLKTIYLNEKWDTVTGFTKKNCRMAA